jgi:hypothetical protein
VVTNRDMSLDPFHALGKLLYNKRLGDDADAAGEVRVHALHARMLRTGQRCSCA